MCGKCILRGQEWKQEDLSDHDTLQEVKSDGCGAMRNIWILDVFEGIIDRIYWFYVLYDTKKKDSKNTFKFVLWITGKSQFQILRLIMLRGGNFGGKKLTFGFKYIKLMMPDWHPSGAVV